MSRKVLLIEPNYKNKFPPIGLMKMATYFRIGADNHCAHKSLVCAGIVERVAMLDAEGLCR